MSKELIRLRDLTMEFDGERILDGINLYINDHEFLTLLGPSGCGKTTTLRIIGGFLTPTSGTVTFDGKVINDVPPYKRQVNTVFQKYALFPHLNVFNNVAFGLKLKVIPNGTKVNRKGETVELFRKYTKAEIKEKVDNALKMVDLEDYGHRNVSSLSGGQQQRVAIARALVNEPEVLLLDEPLGALDLKMRKDMQLELMNMHEKLGITFIYVTHDQEEALTMSDTIVVMNQGYIQQIGTPEMIYNEPENAFVADFIGDSNIIGSTMIKDELVEILGARFACVDKGFGNNIPVDVVIRPEDVELVEPGKGTIDGEVTHLIFKGVHYEMEVMANGFEWLVHSTSLFPVGTKVGIKVDPFNIQIMNKPASEDEEAASIEE